MTVGDRGTVHISLQRPGGAAEMQGRSRGWQKLLTPGAITQCTFSKLCSGCILSPLLKAADPPTSGPVAASPGPAVMDRGSFPLQLHLRAAADGFPSVLVPPLANPWALLLGGLGHNKGNVHMDKALSWGVPFNNEY